MLSNAQVKQAQEQALALLKKANIILSEAEASRIEICDYNLGEYESIGTAIIVYVNTERVCAKELVLLPGQICPEHIHPQLGDYPGKEETFRCRYGEVYLYVPGDPTPNPKGYVPQARKQNFRVWNEQYLLPGDQYTLREQTLHWFQAGPEGAVVSEFSTASFDKADIFTDSDITRITNLDE